MFGSRTWRVRPCSDIMLGFARKMTCKAAGIPRDEALILAKSTSLKGVKDIGGEVELSIGRFNSSRSEI